MRPATGKDAAKEVGKALLFVLWVNVTAFCFLYASQGCQ